MKNTALHTVLSVEKKQEEDAFTTLQTARTEQNALAEQLRQLEEYRKSYESRFEKEGDRFLEASELADYRKFLSNLNHAAEVQSERVAEGAQSVGELQSHWLELHKNKRSMEKLLQRRKTEQLRAEEHKQDRRDQDQFASRHKPSSG